MTTAAPTCEFFSAMRSPAEVERFFRLRRRTAVLAARRGTVPAVRRSRCGKECWLICPTDAWRVWGPK